MHLPIFILNPWPLCYSLVEITDQGTRHYLWALLDWNILHVCSFLSVCIHRPEVLLSTKLSEYTHKFCRSLQSWPVLIVMWHSTNVVATGGMIVEGIPNVTLADSVHCICHISKFWGLWGMCELTPWILELQMTLGNLSHLEAIKHCKLIELELSTSEFKDLWIPSCCQRRKYLRKSPWPTDRNTFAEKQRCLTLTAMF